MSTRTLVQERRDEMIAKLKMAGLNGIKIKKFINYFTYRWGARRRTVRDYTLELVELEAAKIEGYHVYHSQYQTPSEILKIDHQRALSRKS